MTFSERVVKIALSIPKGRVTTYGRIAQAAGGGTMSAQIITSVLSKATKAGLDIQYHRIVYADGKIWVSEERRKERMKLYKKEKIEIDEKDRVRNFRDLLMEFR